MVEKVSEILENGKREKPQRLRLKKVCRKVKEKDGEGVKWVIVAIGDNDGVVIMSCVNL